MFKRLADAGTAVALTVDGKPDQAGAATPLPRPCSRPASSIAARRR